MLVVFLLLLSAYAYCDKILPNDLENNEELETCVVNLLEKYSLKRYGGVVTYIDMNSEKDIITAIHKSSRHTIVSRLCVKQKKPQAYVTEYLIQAGHADNLTESLHFLRLEASWNPSAKFFVIVETLANNDLQIIFQEFLKLHVLNVIVINGTNTVEVYTYNPYENFACGRYFKRVISYGNCNQHNTNFFPNKLITDVRNCTINMALPHIPPFVYDPSQHCSLRNKELCVGYEQYAFELLSKMEHFNIKYTYVDFAQNFSEVHRNMTVSGSFSLVHENTTDGLFGFTVLTDKRAEAFNYVYGYAMNADMFVYVVKRSGFEPVWKSVFLEFNGTVWLLLILCFVVCSGFALILLRPKDKTATLLMMWDTLFLHGFSVRIRFSVKSFFVMWIIFAYLINSYYQSSLMSLTTHPVTAFQAKTEKDLVKDRFESCVTPAIRDFLLNALANVPFDGREVKCATLEDALHLISETDDIYTISPHYLFAYNQPNYYDSKGDSKLFEFPQPVIQVIYAMYFYKGFPMTDKFHRRLIALRENGLMQQYIKNLYYYYEVSHLPKFDNSFKSRAIVPWNISAIGFSIAIIVFILEVLGKNK